MTQVAQFILRDGYCSLSFAHGIVSPGVTYSADIARRKLLQMPLVALRIGNPSLGKSFTILVEYANGVNYARIGNVMNGLVRTCSNQNQPFLEKSCVKMLLGLAQSDRERASLKYAIFKASGMTATKARQQYGFEQMNENCRQIEDAIQSAQEIRETIEEMAWLQDRSILASFGLEAGSNESDSSSSEDSGMEHDTDFQGENEYVEEQDICKAILLSSNFNWFTLQEAAESRFGRETGTILTKVCSSLSQYGFTPSQIELVVQSREAYLASQNDGYDSERIARALNGCIVTDSDSDNPQLYTSIESENLISETSKMLIEKRRKANRKRLRRLRAKAIAERRFLSRKSSKKISRILTECPDIGKEMEKFVTDHSVGADAWRRTGVLTFDGNVKLQNKVTYERIRQHLEKVYQRHFSYGTVVQLCIPRNKKRLSADRYRGLANITTRRARKGFCLKYNPDSHWSAALYKGLDLVHLVDSRDLCLINRDDASGFRLDTLTTCKQYATPTAHENEIVTTRTDFVNKYCSILQVTSYNFTSTQTLGEICAGVVKAPTSVHAKNPCQHACDLQMLEEEPALFGAFVNAETKQPKSVDVIRVDGAADEGPSHEEVRFYWTERHIEKNKIATIVTTRSSGSSYLNRVELQNGCLSRAHANTFIPSTLGGSCMNRDGTVDKDKLKENMMLAVDAYVSRVDGCQCGDTVIHLYRGVLSEEQQKRRDKLLVFLKGSKKAKLELEQAEPTLYNRFQFIRKVMENHMVTGLPSYIFYLLCCFRKDCPHPRCKRGSPNNASLRWYSDGPLLSHLPLPVPDPDHLWGSTSCTRCKGFCSGHYKTQLIDVTDKQSLSKIAVPPSSYLKKLFSDSRGVLTDDQVTKAAQEVLLPVEECKIWLSHLKTILENRQRGAKKAAETRRTKRQKQQAVQQTTGSNTQHQAQATGSNTQHQAQATGSNTQHQARGSNDTQHQANQEEESWYCGSCKRLYEAETEEEESWIECSMCSVWYHYKCEHITIPPPPEVDYICKHCIQY